MAITYRGSQRLSHQQMDNNFAYINNNTIEVTDTTGSALLPSFNSSDPNNVLSDGAFFYDATENNFAFYSNNVKHIILPRGYTGSQGEVVGGTGVSGYTGSKGYTGSIGATGLQGASGDPGTQGATGAVGATGPSGTVAGTSGSAGAVGATGNFGNTGWRGSVGPAAIAATNHLLFGGANSGKNLAFSDNSSTRVGIDTGKTYFGVSAENINNNLYINTNRTSGGVIGTDYTIPLRLNRQSNGKVIKISRSVGANSYTNILYAIMTSTKSLTFSHANGGLIVYDGVVSDYRLKENLIEITKGKLKLINQLKIYSYNDIYDTDTPPQTRYGVLAHELAEIFPDLVSGEKDAMDESNNPIYQIVDYAGLIPALTLALKELTEQIEELEKQVDNL